MADRAADLNDREGQVLLALVDAHIASGEPIGSKALADHARLSVSPQTVRNVLAALSERGLISQPHTSAGRVPTDLGLRYYVRILAGLSVSLGLFNLLPVPGLDGIKMMWLTLEGIVRRNINLKMQEVVNAVGMLLLMGLMAVLFVRDGIRLFG